MKDDTLLLVRIDSKYCDYLRKYDKRVPYNANRKELRPFVGVLFNVGNCKYFAPLSSPKPKHLKIVPKLDFLKIDDGKLGAINFNNMIPVTDENVFIIDLQGNDQYTKLLEKQLYWINRHSDKFIGRSKRLYDKYIDGTLDKRIMDRCCNFPLLEEKCWEYNKLGV